MGELHSWPDSESRRVRYSLYPKHSSGLIANRYLVISRLAMACQNTTVQTKAEIEFRPPDSRANERLRVRRGRTCGLHRTTRILREDGAADRPTESRRRRRSIHAVLRGNQVRGRGTLSSSWPRWAIPIRLTRQGPHPKPKGLIQE